MELVLQVLVLEGCLDQCWPAGASDVLEAWQLDLVSLSDSPLLALRMGQTAFSGLNQVESPHPLCLCEQACRSWTAKSAPA